MEHDPDRGAVVILTRTGMPVYHDLDGGIAWWPNRESAQEWIANRERGKKWGLGYRISPLRKANV